MADLQSVTEPQNSSGKRTYSGSVDTKMDTSDPGLIKIIQAWPNLPEAIRRAMLALVG
jgi:hypothetical protein